MTRQGTSSSFNANNANLEITITEYNTTFIFINRKSGGKGQQAVSESAKMRANV